MDVPKTEEKHVLTKPVTLQTSPNKKKDVETNKNVIAPGMYKVNTNKAKSVLPSTGLNDATSVRRPSSKDSQFKDSVLSNTKKSSEKVEVYVRTNKKTDVASKNVVSNKKIVTDVDVQNALKAKDVLCVSCAKNVLILFYDKRLANYKLNVHSKVKRALFTTPRTTKSKSLDTTPVVSKTRFSVKATQSKSLDITPIVSKTKIAADKYFSTKNKIVDSGYSKHMTGDRSLLKNFVKKFMGTIRFRNDHFAAITGYDDYVQGNITIYHVYFVEGLGHNLFSVGQFCDGDLEVAFRSNTCYVRNLEGDDLLTGARESNLYIISISDMAASSPVCLMSKATSTKSWLWHRRLSHLNFGTINDLTKHDLVDDLPKFKYSKDHMCSVCERGKSKKSSHPPKLVPSIHSKLEWLHMDLCGPMSVEMINGKKYILLNYNAKIHKIRTDNDTEFKNATLKAHYEKLSIMQQFSIARTPQQNGVVERRNRTLVEAARTMLIFSRLPEFLWAEAISTACFTQNRSIIHTRYNKTPYELLHARKPNAEYFYVFGSLCYPINDRDYLGKMKPKADIGIFIWYSKTSKGFQIYNRRTKKIMETIHVKFDELTSMAYEHDRLEPISQRFINDDSSAETSIIPSKKDLDNLFGPMFKEYFERRSLEVSINSAAQTVHTNEESPSTSSIIVDEQEAPSFVTTSEEQTSPISLNNADEFNQEDSADFDGNTVFVPYDAPNFEEAESSTTALDPSDMHEFHQVQPSTHIWTKAHPLEQVIGDPSKPVMTRNRLQTDSELCMYALTVSTLEPKNIKEAMSDHSWIESMQDELHQFERLDVWELVPRPDGKNIIAVKWIWKNKSDAENIVIRNKSRLVAKGYKLKKALYGLKQAPRAWYDKLSSFLIKHHFTKGTVDPTLFTRRHGGDILHVQVYVDNIIFGSTNLDFSKRFVNLMKNNFEMSMMGELKFFLGLQVHQSPRGIFISQSHYAIELLKKHASRPDIAFATFVCARYQVSPMVKHVKKVKRIFRYLRQSYNMGLWYPKDSEFKLIVYSDADHAGCKDDCKSTSGSLQFLSEKLVRWSSKKQDCTAMSTAKAEYVSLSACIIMAQPQRQADVHKDKLCSPNKRYALIDANKKIDLDNSLCPNESKIMANILQNHPLRFSIAASSSIP
ncbi:retrovirus-related pol polyprotein from transposon TNT 1-94 [Tanacetum coccineum]